MRTPEEIREKLQGKNIYAVAMQTGVHLNSLYRFMWGKQKKFHPAGMEKLSAYLWKEEGK